MSGNFAGHATARVVGYEECSGYPDMGVEPGVEPYTLQLVEVVGTGEKLYRQGQEPIGSFVTVTFID